MGTTKVVGQVEIKGTAKQCFEALTDYEKIIDWQSAAESAEVLDYHKDGKGKTVKWVADLKVKKIKYMLEYQYEEPNRITWDFLEGDMKKLDGDYVFEEGPDGKTQVTLTLHVDPGMWVPGPIAKMLNEQMLSRSLSELKKYVEGGKKK